MLHSMERIHGNHHPRIKQPGKERWRSTLGISNETRCWLIDCHRHRNFAVTRASRAVLQIIRAHLSFFLSPPQPCTLWSASLEYSSSSSVLWINLLQGRFGIACIRVSDKQCVPAQRPYQIFLGSQMPGIPASA